MKQFLYEMRLHHEAVTREGNKRPFGCKCTTLRDRLTGDGCDECYLDESSNDEGCDE